jgi:hydroxymethylbilane synthase
MAGLRRLGTGAAFVVPFSVDEVVPAVGQGAIAVETRASDTNLASDLRKAFEDETTRLCICCERSALAKMNAGCSAPIGIYAELHGGVMRVRGFAQSGASIARASLERRVSCAFEAEALGAAMAAELLR